MIRFSSFAAVLLCTLQLAHASIANPQTPAELKTALSPHAEEHKLHPPPSFNSNINSDNKYLMSHGLALTAPHPGNFKIYGALTFQSQTINSKTTRVRGELLYIDTKSTDTPQKVYIFRRGGGGDIGNSYVAEPAEEYVQKRLKPSQKLIIEEVGKNAERKWKSSTGAQVSWDTVLATSWGEARSAYAQNFINPNIGIDTLDKAKNLPDGSLFNHVTRLPWTDDAIDSDVRTALKKRVIAVQLVNAQFDAKFNLTPSKILKDVRKQIIKSFSIDEELMILNMQYVDAVLDKFRKLRHFGGIATRLCN